MSYIYNSNYVVSYICTQASQVSSFLARNLGQSSSAQMLDIPVQQTLV